MTSRDPSASLVRKLWHFCNVLRDDGLSYPDYVEQLTYLLFLKMADEQDGGPVPSQYGWRSFSGLDAAAMDRHYGEVLTALGKQRGTLGLIFRNAKNKISDPAKLRLLIVELIGQTEWTGLSADLKGDAYEGLLEKNARDTKSGAGQYFTPRPLIEAIVECVAPRPGEVICDPACGTAGFLLAASDLLRARSPTMSEAERAHLRTKTIRGVELVPEVARLATMNLLLHGISGKVDDELPITCADSLREQASEQVDIVLTNPPFGVKGSVTYGAKERRGQRGSDDLTIVRSDFWVETANKQLNFLQHIVSLLKPGGRAAVVLPDNALFETGAAASIRRRLMQTCNLHTLLKLPTGLFYAQGVKANVLFFERKSSPIGRLWVYDLRTGHNFSLKTRPIRASDLSEFVRLYDLDGRNARAADEVSSRWRSFAHEAILSDQNCRLDMDWTEEDLSGNPPSLLKLDEIASQITKDLQHALELINKVTARE